MRSRTPTLHCDAEGGCDEWEVDHYETCAHSVGGVRITAGQRAPGWVSTDTEDLCPEHSSERGEVEVVDLVGALRASVEVAKARRAQQQAKRGGTS